MDDLEALAATPRARSPLAAAQLDAAVAVLGARWSVDAGKLALALPGPGMARTTAAAAAAGQIADALDHHPTIALDYHRMVLAIDTHDAHALTAFDLIFAARLEQWLRAHHD